MARIKIIAIGGGGNNALNRLLERDWENVDCIAANTDKQALDCSDAKIKILLGEEIMHGMGSGCNPMIGKKAAILSNDEIRASIKGADTVIILVGLGGGTGTGGAPVVAEIAKEVGADVVAVVFTPFAFEGKRRCEQAEAGLAALNEEVDSVIIIQCQRMLMTSRTSTLLQAFSESDWLMNLAVSSVVGIFSPFSLASCNVTAVQNMLLSGGITGLGFGSAAGENRAITALQNAMASPHFEGHAIGSSCSILIGINGPADLRLSEINEVILTIRDLVCSNAHIAFSISFNEKVGDSVWITIISIKGI